MDDQLLRYRNYVRGIRSLLLFAGLWPSRKWHDNFVYRRLSTLNAFICLTMSCVVLNFCRHHSTNLDLLTKSIGIMGSYLSAVLKVKTILFFLGGLDSQNSISRVVVTGRGILQHLKVMWNNRPLTRAQLGKRIYFFVVGLRSQVCGLEFLLPAAVFHITLSIQVFRHLKVICFLVNRKELMKLHRTLEKHFEEIIDDPELRGGVFDSLSVFVNPSVAITILVFIGTLVFFLTPVIVLAVQYSSGAYPLKFILPYPGMYPWWFEGGGAVYYLHYCWEVLAGSYLFCVTSGVDSLFGYYIFQMHAIFRTMSISMRKLDGTNDDHKTTIIRNCVFKHRMLARCRDNVQKIYGPIVLWMFLTSAIIMCTLIFQASETREMTIGYAILFAVYISMKLLQALMYAWYGGIVSTESEEFREAVYASGWPGSGDKPLMNNILIMMYHKPLILTACKFLIISTDMFTAIVNATMSYFFLLQTLDDGK